MLYHRVEGGGGRENVADQARTQQGRVSWTCGGGGGCSRASDGA